MTTTDTAVNEAKSVEQKVAETFQQALRAQVAQRAHKTFGQADALVVIERLFELVVSDEDVQLEGFDAIKQYVDRVLNTSQLCAVLEKLPEDHPAHIRREKKATTAKSGISF